MTEQLYQNFEPDDPLGIIAEQNKGRFLDMATLHWFSGRGRRWWRLTSRLGLASMWPSLGALGGEECGRSSA